jgi:CTP:molybdopterin cytidylyltransferase MocA
LDTEGDLIVPVFAQKPGHPVLFSKSSRQRLLENDEVHSLAEFCAQTDTFYVEVGDPEILWDIDTPDDLTVAKARFANQERR